MTRPPPEWRSMLYMPATARRFLAKAHERGADAIILDLEDSIPSDRKVEARIAASEAIPALREAGVSVVVRVNRDLRMMAADLEAVATRGIKAVVLPKVEGPHVVRAADEILSSLESEMSTPVGETALVIRIENPMGLLKIAKILEASTRIRAIGPGTADLARETGWSDTSPALEHVFIETCIAARAFGVLPVGLVGAIDSHEDLDAFRNLANRSRELGSTGSQCIHPSQVPILNEVFGTGASDQHWAQRVVEAYEQNAGAGTGAFMLDGRLVDEAVYKTAQSVLQVER